MRRPGIAVVVLFAASAFLAAFALARSKDDGGSPAATKTNPPQLIDSRAKSADAPTLDSGATPVPRLRAKRVRGGPAPPAPAPAPAPTTTTTTPSTTPAPPTQAPAPAQAPAPKPKPRKGAPFYNAG
jgi:hypothetical protein